MSSDASSTIAIVSKNGSEEFRFDLSAYKGHDLVGVRVWYSPRDGTPGSTMLPGKAGIMFRVVRLDEMILALQQVREEAVKRRLLP